jgi:hypothetical protein
MELHSVQRSSCGELKRKTPYVNQSKQENEMRPDQKTARLPFRFYRKLALAFLVGTAGASAPLAGLGQSDTGPVLVIQSRAIASQQQPSPTASSSSLDAPPDEPMPHGQQQPALPPTDRSQAPFINGRPETESAPLRFTRALGIVPVVEAPSDRDGVAPLSAGQKFEFFVKPTFDPSVTVIAVVGTLLSAKGTSQPAFGGGAAAYGQKAGATAADYASNNLFAKALLPIVLHQDPRFFRKQDGGVLSRFMYGISRPFVTRTDDDHNTLNISYLGGVAMTVALSNAYYPENNRNAADSAARYGEVIGVSAAVNVIREFLTLTH